MASLFSTINNVVGANKEEVPVSSLQGKMIGLYFSAHWCPPCRQFTPRLAEWVQGFKKGPNGDKMEFVFVSSDRTEKDFEEYHKTMGFLAVPFDEEDLRTELGSTFKVQGIPTLVFVNEKGDVVTRDGRSVVVDDPTAAGFPWAPKSIDECCGHKFVNNAGQEFTRDHLKGKTVGIYFSASWCGPCHMFTPILKKMYEKLNAAGKPFEVIFASSDRDKDSFNTYFSEMPWIAIPFEDRGRKNDLSKHFEVQGIPTLVILDENLNLISKDGRMAVMEDPEGADFPWTPKPFNKFSERFVDDLNEKTCFVAFTHGDSAAEQTICSALEQIADDYKNKFSLMYSGEDDEFVESVSKFLGLKKEGNAPTVCIFNLPKNQIAYDRTSPITAASLKSFLDAFSAGTAQISVVRKA